MFTRILVPLDGSARAERAIPVAARIARASGASLLIVQVLSMEGTLYFVPGAMTSESVIEAELAQVKNYLAQVATHPELQGVTVENVAMIGWPASLLVSIIHACNVDLVVMCSHGRTGFKHWALGSVAEQVARQSPAPVLILREKGPVPAGLHPDVTQPLRILVPLDGSLHAKAALAPAADLIAALAKPANGALHLLRVVALPHTKKERQTLRNGKDIKEHLLYRAKKYLQATEEHLKEGLITPTVHEHHIAVTWSVALDNDVAHAIVGVAKNGEDTGGSGIFGECDLIAIATHGRSGLNRLTMGSVAERVLQTTNIPVLLVRPPKTTRQLAATEEHKVPAGTHTP